MRIRGTPFLRRLALAATLAGGTGLGYSLPSAAADALDKVKASCATEWPGDFRMQDYCVRRQLDGARDMFAWMDVHEIDRRAEGTAAEADPYVQIFALCSQRWLDGQDNYRMTAYCLRTQTNALDRLN